MTRRATFTVLILLVAAGALAFRLPRLRARVMHCDEANQAVRAGHLFDEGIYRYDPREHHGPTLYYLTLPALWLSGAESFAQTDERHYRVVPVAFGAGLVVLLLLVGDGFGRPAAVCAGVFTAISPAMVFYSRYYIQEMLLVFFTFAAIAAGWRYVWSRKARWAVLAGAALALMHATKETCVLAYAAMALAVVAKVGWRRWWGYPVRVRRLVEGRHVLAAAVVGLAVSVLFFSSFFSYWRGPLDSVLAYTHYLRRSGGAGLHEQPWSHYLKMLLYTHYVAGPWWSEALIIALAVVGFVAVLWPTRTPEAQAPLVRFVAFYTLFLTAAYALVPYKTPWCILGFLHGMILLAGVGAVALVRAMPWRPLKALAGAVLVVAAFQLAGQAYRGSYTFSTDRRNPYVYAHTSTDLLHLVERVEQIAPFHPDGHRMPVHVMATDNDYWPLPWYLRRVPKARYWDHVPEEPDAPIIIASQDLMPELESKRQGQYFAALHGIRPTVHVLLYIRWDLWEKFLETRTDQPPPDVSRRPPAAPESPSA
ncbi:MAG: flippase activity-associated protein Agl23 [Candidatus Brocadiia bacterium]